MKALSVLLLLALGLGSAWWRITHPSGTLDDARREAVALGVRLQDSAATVGDGARTSFARLVGPDDPGADVPTGSDAAVGLDGTAAEPTDAADPGEPASATPVARSGDASGPDAPTDTDPSLDPLAAVTEPVGGSDGDVPTDGFAADEAAGTTSDDASAEVTTRLAALEERLSETPNASAANVVRGRLTDAERRLDVTANRENAMLERLEAIDGRLGRIAERLEASSIESNRRQDDADGRLDAIDSALAALGERGDVLANRLDTLGADRLAVAEEPPADPDGSAPESDGERDGVAGGDAVAAAVDRRLAAVEARLARASSGAVAPEDDRLEALARRVDALAAARPAAPEANGAAVDAAQAEIGEELAAIDRRIGDGSTRGDVPALERALDGMRERLGALGARVRELPAASTAADEAGATQDALEERLRALEGRMEALPADTGPAFADPDGADPDGADPGGADPDGETRGRVDALASRDSAVRDELREAKVRSNEYKIYFDRDSTTISAAAARVLDSFIVQEKNRTTGVSIFGFTDRRGPASYNQRLALERATNVRAYLVRNGLPSDKVRTLNGLGEDAVAATLPDEAEDARQRAVVLYAAQP